MNWKIYMRGRFLGYARAASAEDAKRVYAEWSGVGLAQLEARAQ